MVLEKGKEISEDLGILLVYLMFPAIVALITIFAEGGISVQQIFDKIDFYNTILIIGVSAIFIFIVGKLATSGRNPFWNVDLHNPNNSYLGKNNSVTRFLQSKINTFLVAVLLFGLLFMGSALGPNVFWSVPQEQQVTTTGKLFVSVYPASPAETLFFIAILLILNGTVWFFAKRKIPFTNMSLDKNIIPAFILFINPLIIAIGGVILHEARYGFSDLNVVIVLLFWFMGAFITNFTGCVLFFLIMHDINNLVSKSLELFSSDTVVTTIIISLIAIFILLVVINIFKRRK